MEKDCNNTEHMSFDLYKSQAIHYKTATKLMLRAFLKKVPRDLLIQTLKDLKLIKNDWRSKGNVYLERKVGEKI